LGELTGSIAHDFNNLLTAIIAPIELLLDELEPSTPIARQLSQVNETAHYAASLTQQLLAFCRTQAPLRRVVDVNQVLTLLQPTLEGGTGPELVAELRGSLSSARVVYVTGYADEETWRRRLSGARGPGSPSYLRIIVKAV
jgi:signal transduction histidine kinase